MKKYFVGLCAILSVVGMVGVANAAPMTWTDTIDFNPNVYVGVPLTYTHDISDQGFKSFLMGGDDIVFSYTLTVDLFDDQNNDKFEKAFINQPGLIGDGYVTDFTYANDFGWSIAGLLKLNLDGKIDVSISRTKGDFMVDSSRLTALGDNGTAPVPEPATMLLFGTGIIGLAGVARRKRK